MNKQNQLAAIHHSGKPYIIYKSKKGFDLFTDFSKKIILNNKNISNFLGKRYKSKSKNTDLFIGFIGYELLNNLINIKIPKPPVPSAGPATRYNIAINNVRIEPIIIRIIPITFRIIGGINSMMVSNITSNIWNNNLSITTFPNC
mgnify:CR=1 FL=1